MVSAAYSYLKLNVELRRRSRNNEWIMNSENIRINSVLAL